MLPVYWSICIWRFAIYVFSCAIKAAC